MSMVEHFLMKTLNNQNQILIIRFENMPTLLLLYFVVIISASGNSLSLKPKIFYRQDYVYINKYQAFYKFDNTPKAWADAVSSCFSEEAELFFPSDETELYSIKEEVEELFDDVAIHVAMMNSSQTDGFYTLDGKQVEEVYNVWSRENLFEPGDNCVMLKNMTSLSSSDCTKKLPFLCKKMLHTEITLPCNTIDKGYEFHRDSKCYKIHKKPQNWATAFKTCLIEDARLAIPTKPFFSIEHPTNPREYYQTSPRKAEPYSTKYFVGFRELMNKKTYVFLNGKLVTDAFTTEEDTEHHTDLNNYGEGNYLNYLRHIERRHATDEKEFCGVQLSDDAIGIEDCNTEYPFVCEKLL